MQKQTQTDEPETLESVRARLAARRTEAIDEEAEAVVVASEDPPAYLLGGPAADVAACVIGGLVPALVMYASIRFLDGALAGGAFLGASVVVLMVWTAFFTLLRPMRTARIALVWTLLLYSLFAIFLLSLCAYTMVHPEALFTVVGIDPKLSPWALVLPAFGVVVFHGFAFWKAYRKG